MPTVRTQCTLGRRNMEIVCVTRHRPTLRSRQRGRLGLGLCREPEGCEGRRTTAEKLGKGSKHSRRILWGREKLHCYAEHRMFCSFIHGPIFTKLSLKQMPAGISKVFKDMYHEIPFWYSTSLKRTFFTYSKVKETGTQMYKTVVYTFAAAEKTLKDAQSFW